jgi:hypothetical protein
VELQAAALHPEVVAADCVCHRRVVDSGHVDLDRGRFCLIPSLLSPGSDSGHHARSGKEHHCAIGITHLESPCYSTVSERLVECDSEPEVAVTVTV